MKTAEKIVAAQAKGRKRGKNALDRSSAKKETGPGSRRPRGDKKTISVNEGLARAQKMESLGMIAGGLAHDFNNHLEVILGFASLARLKLPQRKEVQEPVRMIEEAARRAADLATQLLELTREGAEPQDSCDPSAALRRILKIIRRTFDRKIRIESRIEPALPWVRGDQQHLEQAILNLAINARDAMPEGGVLSIAASRCNDPERETNTALSHGRGETTARARTGRSAHGKPGGSVRITVEDNGAGMEPAVLRRIFDPFFTTKPEGTGLGLAMVKKTLEDSGGSIEVKSRPGKGSRFLAFLPAAAAHGKAAEKHGPKVSRGGGTVLVVDDEPMVVNFVEKGLKQLGYTVMTAETGMRACELYAEHKGEIACVLLDMVMPEMSGLETYEKLRQIDPAAKIILSSGYTRSSLGEMASEADFLGKPYTVESLSLAIKRAREE